MKRYEVWLQLNYHGSIRLACDIDESNTLAFVEPDRTKDFVFASHWPEGKAPFTMVDLEEGLKKNYCEKKVKTLIAHTAAAMRGFKKQFMEKEIWVAPTKTSLRFNDTSKTYGKVLCYLNI